MNFLDPSGITSALKSLTGVTNATVDTVLDAPNLVEVIAQIPFQENGRWIMFFPHAPNLVPYIESVTVPTYTFKEDEYTKAITEFTDVSTITVIFREDTLGSVQAFLGEWESLIWDRFTKVFKDEQFRAKKQALLILDDLEIGAATIAYRFVDMRYLGMQPLTFSSGDTDIMKIQANFSVRYVFPYYLRNLYGSIPIP